MLLQKKIRRFGNHRKMVCIRCKMPKGQWLVGFNIENKSSIKLVGCWLCILLQLWWLLWRTIITYFFIFLIAFDVDNKLGCLYILINFSASRTNSTTDVTFTVLQQLNTNVAASFATMLWSKWKLQNNRVWNQHMKNSQMVSSCNNNMLSE